MWLVILAIVGVWCVLFGAAYLCRVAAGLSRTASIAILTACYLTLSGVALVWFGFDRSGFLGVFGMSLPYVVATLLVLPPPRRQPL